MIIIYTISSPSVGVFYIGKTNNFNHRKCMHRHPKYFTKLSNFIKDLQDNGEDIEFEILDIVNDRREFEIERFWINQFKIAGIKLKNTSFHKPYSDFILKRFNITHPSVEYYLQKVTRIA